MCVLICCTRLVLLQVCMYVYMYVVYVCTYACISTGMYSRMWMHCILCQSLPRLAALFNSLLVHEPSRCHGATGKPVVVLPKPGPCGRIHCLHNTLAHAQPQTRSVVQRQRRLRQARICTLRLAGQQELKSEVVEHFRCHVRSPGVQRHCCLRISISVGRKRRV
jgi:hypothetical protein